MDMDMNYMMSLRDKKPGDKLSVGELAVALYEGMPQLSNLAETLARNYGKAEALSFFGLMGADVRNFYYGIAEQLIEHAKHWKKNKGSACVLDEQERKRLKDLPRVKLTD